MANIIKTTNKPNKKQLRAKRRQLLIIGTGLLIVIVAAVAIWYFVIHNRPAYNTPGDFTQSREEKQLDTIRNSITVEGDVDKSRQALEKAVKEAESNEQKSEFYAERALALFYKENADEKVKREALVAALEAYKLSKSGGNARLVEMIAIDLGEEELAAEYGAIVEKKIKENPTPEMQAEAKGGVE